MRELSGREGGGASNIFFLSLTSISMRGWWDGEVPRGQTAHDVQSALVEELID